MTNEQIAERLEAALTTRDLAALGELLAPDARWGDDFHVNKCRSRDDVIRTFSRVMGEGVGGSVIATTTGAHGVVCELDVRWSDPAHRSRGDRFYHSYIVRDGKIAEIQRHDDELSALAAIGD